MRIQGSKVGREGPPHNWWAELLSRMTTEKFNTRKATCQKPIDTDVYGGVEPQPWVPLRSITGTSSSGHIEVRRKSIAVAAATSFICELCPIREACLEEGQTMRFSGVWGGKYLVDGVINPTVNQDIEARKQALAE